MPVPARIALMTAAFITVACSPPAIEYAPPPQRVQPTGAEASHPKLVRVSDPNVAKPVVQDVMSDQPGSAWRWTNAHPRLKVLLDGNPVGYEFVVEFTVPDVVLKKVGPLGVKFVVNDRVVGSARYAKEGRQEFRTLVTKEMITSGDQAVFGFDVDPPYVADDGVRLGVLLEAIGFRRTATK